jgi:ABC-type phosphate transport system substrate-binding protein
MRPRSWVTGAGATFPYPIYSKWFSDYAAKTGIKINYQSIGSGGGIRQLSEQTVDFGASDAPMSDAEMASAKGGPGKGKDVKWPVGLGGKGNEGVTGQVKQTPGAVGYVELAYARQNKLPTAAVRNAAGKFIEPSIEAVTAAAAGVAQKLPPTTDYRISIVNAPGADAYPISSFTWILLYKTQPNAEKGKKLLDFLHWALHDGEQSASTLDYAPLPAMLVARLDSTLATMKVGAAP